MTEVMTASASTGTHSHPMAIRYARHACSPALSDPDMPQIMSGTTAVMQAMMPSSLRP